MTHKELITRFVTERFTDAEAAENIEMVRKGSISRCNYINLIFKSEPARDRYIETHGLDNCSKCERRYGIGLILNQYT